MKNHAIRIGNKILNMSVSNHPGTVLKKYIGAVTARTPAAKPPYSLVYFLTKKYAGMPHNGPISAGSQKQTVKEE